MSEAKDVNEAPLRPQVELRRADLYGHPGGRSLRRLSFTYAYKTITDETLSRRDGTTFFQPAGTWVEYGTGLSDLREMLRRKYGRGVTFTETWK